VLKRGEEVLKAVLPPGLLTGSCFEQKKIKSSRYLQKRMEINRTSGDGGGRVGGCCSRTQSFRVSMAGGAASVIICALAWEIKISFN